MDKKKIKELIEKAKNNVVVINAISISDVEQIDIATFMLEQALDELSKSDWVSVEDDLPDYGEVVLVTDENAPDDMWFGHRTADTSVVVDEHGFAKGYGTITHWKRVSKVNEII